MSAAPSPHDLRAALPGTWSAFFARHGGFTEVQRRAIVPILDGHDTLVVAPTASGKTEAVLAPLIERHVLPVAPGPARLRLVYLCPTRALVRDLFWRLESPLGSLGVSLAMKTGDTAPVPIRRPPAVLLTTPESLDALLTRAPRLLVPLAALVLDEIHLLDGTVRGDQVRCLLARIERIQAHAKATSPTAAGRAAPPAAPGRLQRVALSATVADPEGIAGRYLADPVVVQVAGARELLADLRPMADLADLAQALGERASRKVLVFCNTRHEVEQVAAYLRHGLPYEAAVFTHYGNLDPAVRRQVEADFAAAAVAVCVASSTLELGIDIGGIDDIALVGSPHTVSSFLQRVGRGARRGGDRRVLCLARTPGEELRFRALLAAARSPADRPGHGGSPYHFKPSVLVQQIFSQLKQSPTGALRLADLRALAPASVPDESLRSILTALTASSHLRAGRSGEWLPGLTLAQLADAHEIYANIGGEPLDATVVDAFSGRPLARAARPRQKGEGLLLGGRQVQVAWRDGYKFGVESVRGGGDDERLRFRTAPYAIPFEVTQAVAAQLGLPPGRLPVVVVDGGSLLFHFWGDLYGALLAAMLATHFPPETFAPIEPANELCLRLGFELPALPAWDESLAREQALALSARLEPFLELGRFQPLLPLGLRQKTVLAHCDLVRLAELWRQAMLRPVEEVDALYGRLVELV